MPNRDPFPIRASKISLWMSLAAISASVASVRESAVYVRVVPSDLLVVVFLVSMVLYTFGVILGVVGLVGIRKYGADELLIRSVIGIGFSGFFFGCTALASRHIFDLDLVAASVVMATLVIATVIVVRWSRYVENCCHPPPQVVTTLRGHGSDPGE